MLRTSTLPAVIRTCLSRPNEPSARAHTFTVAAISNSTTLSYLRHHSATSHPPSPPPPSSSTTTRFASSPFAAADDHDFASAANPSTDVPRRILKTALRDHVPRTGWTTASLAAAARDVAGYPHVTAGGLFPRGGVDLVAYFLEEARKDLKTKVEERVRGDPVGWDRLERLEKLRWIIETRLRSLEPYVERWPEAMALMANPTHAPTALHLLHRLSDDICHLSGDRSVDASWYHRRLAVSTVYASTELFMLQDASKDREATLDFLDRRLKDANGVERGIAEVGAFTEFAVRSAYGILVSKGFKA